MSVLLIVVGAALLVAAQATASGAAISPHVLDQSPGPVTITVSNALIHLQVQGVDIDAGPFDGTLTGTFDEFGQMTFPKSGITFTAFDQNILVAAHIAPVATGGWTGTIDPSTNQVSITGPMSTIVSVASIPGFTGCPIGPFTIPAASTNYSTGDGSAHASGTYLVNEVAAGQAGCASNEGSLNTILGLPASSSIDMDLVVDPILTGVGQPPPPTTTFTVPTTTTTAGPATTAPGGGTVAPTATGGSGSLPRTGGTTAPLTVIGLSLLGAGGLLLFTRRRHISD